VLNSIH